MNHNYSAWLTMVADHGSEEYRGPKQKAHIPSLFLVVMTTTLTSDMGCECKYGLGTIMSLLTSTSSLAHIQGQVYSFTHNVQYNYATYHFIILRRARLERNKDETQECEDVTSLMGASR